MCGTRPSPRPGSPLPVAHFTCGVPTARCVPSEPARPSTSAAHDRHSPGRLERSRSYRVRAMRHQAKVIARACKSSPAPYGRRDDGVAETETNGDQRDAHENGADGMRSLVGRTRTASASRGSNCGCRWVGLRHVDRVVTVAVVMSPRLVLIDWDFGSAPDPGPVSPRSCRLQPPALERGRRMSLRDDRPQPWKRSAAKGSAARSALTTWNDEGSLLGLQTGDGPRSPSLPSARGRARPARPAGARLRLPGPVRPRWRSLALGSAVVAAHEFLPWPPRRTTVVRAAT